MEEYTFDKDKGISGILLPDGKFLKCNYACHAKIIQKINKKDEDQIIFFSSKMIYNQDTESHNTGIVYFNLSVDSTHLTTEQNAWIEAHKQYLDAGQKLDIFDYFNIMTGDEQNE